MRDKVYFASDMHLGAQYHPDPLAAERKLVRWLKSIQDDAYALVLVGDVFDYWYEYKYVAPRGHVRFLGALAELADSGVEIHYFTGNHDVWIFDYLPTEIGLTLHQEPTVLEFFGKRFFVAHGDEYELENKRFQFLRRIFHSPICQKLYSWIHPDLSSALARGWSLSSREKGTREHDIVPYRGEDKEYLIRFAKKHTADRGADAPDFFIFGHRHLMLHLMITHSTQVVILGDWIHYDSYAVWDGDRLVLDYFEPTED